MSALPPDPEKARSVRRVVDAHDSARPPYPDKAVAWMVAQNGARVLELGAGTGKLTEQLAGLGHTVTATDPSEAMLRRIRARAPQARAVIGAAEHIPLASGSVDVVVATEAFHGFDHQRALPEVARVLRPGGVLAVAWNSRDERIPWVKRLGAIIGEGAHQSDPTRAIDDSGMFETVEKSSFRIWQPMDQESLRNLVSSSSHVAVLSGVEREGVLGKVDELYDGYGRGADGMLLPYVTSTFRATVLPRSVWDPEQEAVGPDDMDTDALLIDFN